MPEGENRRRPLRVAVRRSARLTRRAWRALLNRIARSHPSPLFLIGNQKSGTTAIAALLAEATRTRVTLDLEDLQEPVRTRLYNGEISLEEFVSRNRYDFSRPMIKEPALTFFYAELRDIFPRARFMLIVRDPRDNIRSILDRVGLEGTVEDIPSETRDSLDPGWLGIIYSPWLDLEGTTYIEKLAHRWNAACDVHLRNPDTVRLLRYEDFRENKSGTIENLAEELGLEPVADISGRLEVQFQPKGTHRDAPWEEFFSPENLIRIESICGERMERVGY